MIYFFYFLLLSIFVNNHNKTILFLTIFPYVVLGCAEHIFVIPVVKRQKPKK